MQAFVASLTAALLFTHTVFGCCWHHAHACEHGSADTQRVICCPQHEDGEEGEQHETPCGCQVQCKGTCAYVLPQKLKVEAPQWIAIDLTAALPSLLDLQMEAASSFEAGLSLSDLAPPLRLHLVHQVLLN